MHVLCITHVSVHTCDWFYSCVLFVCAFVVTFLHGCVADIVVFVLLLLYKMCARLSLSCRQLGLVIEFACIQ